MAAVERKWQWRCFAMAAALLGGTIVAVGAEKTSPAKKIGTYDAQAATVEMFSAMKKGDISVRLIPKNSLQCQVLIKNNTDKPLNVKLPEAFAGVPVLGQIGGGGGRSSGRSSGRSGGSSGGGNQGMGGGMGGMGGGGMGGGMFSVPPEKVGKFKVATVCLEHGKNEPREAIPYEIRPIESFTAKPGVRELCQMLGHGQINQRAAQAAAWHLNSGMSWETLAAKRIRHANGDTESYFSGEEIQAGMQIAASAIRTAKERQLEEEKSGTKSEKETGVPRY